MQQSTRREPAIFVCTPEIVRTWLLYPLWLHVPHVFPKRIVIDDRDYQHIHRRVKREPHKATPYDVATWLRVGDFGGLIDHSFAYDAHATPQRITVEAHNLTVRLRKTLGKDDLHRYMAESFKHWLVYGLEQKRRLLGADQLYQHAIRATENEYMAILNSKNFPFDPELLLERHLAKLLVGLETAKVVRKKYGGRVLVYDTGEFSFAANLLCRDLRLDPRDHFAISDKIDFSFEDNLREELSSELGLCLPGSISDPRVSDFSAAIAEFTRDLSHGRELPEIAVEAEDALQQRRDQIHECMKYLGLYLGLSFPATDSANNLISQALSLQPSQTAVASISMVAMGLRWVLFRSTACRELTAGLGNMARLRLRRYVEGGLAFGTQGWRKLLIHLSRIRWPRSAASTEDEKRRQMMDPWVRNPVWYHDMEAKNG